MEVKNVAKISAANAASLIGKKFFSNRVFAPQQDSNGNWILSLFEAGYLDRSEVHFQIISWSPPEEEPTE